MVDSMAQGEAPAADLEPSLWKTVLSWVAGILLALTFIWAGVGKITDPFGTAAGLSRTCTPADLSLPLAILLGIGETYAGVLILVPRFRRWGAWLGGFLLVVFMAYVGANYQALRGEECGCFPWLERLFPWARQTVKPAFFLRDATMLALAVLAGWWARAAGNKRSAALVLGAVAVFGLACFGVLAARQTGVAAPESVTVDGRPFPLRQGRVFLYFYDPECSYCDAAARLMAQYRWKDTTVISVATAQPQFAREFIQSTGLGGLIFDRRRTAPQDVLLQGPAVRRGSGGRPAKGGLHSFRPPRRGLLAMEPPRTTGLGFLRPPGTGDGAAPAGVHRLSENQPLHLVLHRPPEACHPHGPVCPSRCRATACCPGSSATCAQRGKTPWRRFWASWSARP